MWLTSKFAPTHKHHHHRHNYQIWANRLEIKHIYKNEKQMKRKTLKGHAPSFESYHSINHRSLTRRWKKKLTIWKKLVGDLMQNQYCKSWWACWGYIQPLDHANKNLSPTVHFPSSCAHNMEGEVVNNHTMWLVWLSSLTKPSGWSYSQSKGKGTSIFKEVWLLGLQHQKSEEDSF